MLRLYGGRRVELRREYKIGRMSEPLCVFCRRRPIDEKLRPFCSERCQLQDLAKWADGSYRVAAERVGESDDNGENDETGDSD